jgi:hypothetical protein
MATTANPPIQVASGTFTGSGQASSGVLCRNGSAFLNLSGSGTWTVVVATSTDDGATWQQFTQDAAGNALDLTHPYSGPVYVGAAGVLIRVECSAWTSGSPAYRLAG